MKFSHVITTVDTHTVGNPTRVITAGLPFIPGRTMKERQAYLRDHLDWVRPALLHEPRGHGGMFGAVLTPPASPEADLGALYIQTWRYLDMCGHATIGVGTVAIELGLVPVKEPETTFSLEVPAGLIPLRVGVRDSRAAEVTFRNRPAFPLALDAPIEVPGIGRVLVDIAYGGNCFVILPASAVGLRVRTDDAAALVDWGPRFMDAANAQLRLTHPETGEPLPVNHTMFTGDPQHPEAHGKNLVVPGVRQFDRSPCGTGTCARMSILHARGALRLGEEFVHEGIAGTVFRGRPVQEARVGSTGGIIPEITGSAYITGFQQFVIDPVDPLRHGFLIA